MKVKKEKREKEKCGRKNAEGKMRPIKIKKMHLPLGAQPRRATINDMMGVERSSEGRKKGIICVTNA
jgi:hypothetical protein